MIKTVIVHLHNGRDPDGSDREYLSPSAAAPAPVGHAAR
jgi:hypothetical protein